MPPESCGRMLLYNQQLCVKGRQGKARAMVSHGEASSDPAPPRGHTCFRPLVPQRCTPPHQQRASACPDSAPWLLQALPILQSSTLLSGACRARLGPAAAPCPLLRTCSLLLRCQKAESGSSVIFVPITHGEVLDAEKMLKLTVKSTQELLPCKTLMRLFCSCVLLP